MRLLQENNGYLPYNDKSSPEDIYAFFGMSKKTFKMTTGNLYKNRKIRFTQTGIQLVEEWCTTSLYNSSKVIVKPLALNVNGEPYIL